MRVALVLMAATLIQCSCATIFLDENFTHSFFFSGDLHIKSVVLVCPEEKAHPILQNLDLWRKNIPISVSQDMEQSLIRTTKGSLIVFCDVPLDNVNWSLPMRVFEANLWMLPYETRHSMLEQISPSLNSMLHFYECGPKSCKLYEFYSIKSKVFFKRYGSWKSGAFSPMLSMWERRKNMEGIQLAAIVEHNPPLTILKMDGQKVLGIQGKIWNIVVSLQDKMNFTYTLQVPPDREFGKIVNGVWTGIVRQLQLRTVDISIADVGITEERRTVVDFANVLYYESLKLYMQRSRPAPQLLDSIVSMFGVFEPQLWLSIGGLLVCLVLAFVILFKLANYRRRSRVTKAMSIVGLSAIELDASMESSSLSMHILFLTTLFSTYFIFETFCAMLTSVFTFQVYTTGINGFEDILNSDYQMNIWAGTTAEQFLLKVDQGSAAAKVYREMKQNPRNLAPDTSTGLKMVLDNPKSIHFGYDSIIQALLNTAFVKEQCNIKILKKKFSTYPISFAFQKNSDLIRMFNYHLTNLYENGDIEKNIWRAFEPFDESLCTEPGLEQIGFRNVSFLFLFLLIGAAVAIGVLIVEKRKLWELRP